MRNWALLVALKRVDEAALKNILRGKKVHKLYAYRSHRFFSVYFAISLAVFLRFAKNTANICGNFCAPQKILQIFAVAIIFFRLILRYF